MNQRQVVQVPLLPTSGYSLTARESSSRADRSDAWTQDVYWREGDAVGEPKFQTVAGNPFM